MIGRCHNDNVKAVVIFWLHTSHLTAANPIAVSNTQLPALVTIAFLRSCSLWLWVAFCSLVNLRQIDVDMIQKIFDALENPGRFSQQQVCI